MAIGDGGWLFINSNFVSSFALGDVTGPGEVAVVTGAYTGDEVQGAVTRFKDFKGYQLTKQYGPAEGKLKKEPGFIATHRSGVRSRDLVVEAEFVNPQGRDWDYGFLIRNSGFGRLEVIGVTDDGRWFHYSRDVEDEEYTEVGFGSLSNWTSGRIKPEPSSVNCNRGNGMAFCQR